VVDFKKHLTDKKTKKPTDPIELYDTLDRAHDKGPLRPVQSAVLSTWHAQDPLPRDIIVKLHTGQGKTLIGLLMLQSRLNSGNGPVAYLCPNNFLIEQTCEQARQFGIKTCVADPELPDEFLNSQETLVTSVQKLFNGRTKFGLRNQSIPIDTLLMDDAHACADSVRQSCRIRIESDKPPHAALRTLFASELEAQGAGTWADIENNKRDALLPVPYWAWLPKESEVAGILSKNADSKYLKFVWPLLKDMLPLCDCFVSGTAVEIEPRIAPLDAFGSYWKAKHRIFMSATVTDDAFLIKGLQLKAATIQNPLGDPSETWSGERMILLPSLMDRGLEREEIVAILGKSAAKRTFGVVALVPSFARTKDWERYGANIAQTESVGEIVNGLKKGTFDRTVVLANRYDGIDLPDDACRVLVFDSRPYSESLSDLYQEYCRPNSEATLMRTVRTIEQGMGRSVRGDKDYCVVVAIGADLIRLLRDRNTRHHLSPEMGEQIDLGLEIAEMAMQEIAEGENPKSAFQALIRQCLARDLSWKAFYKERMDQVRPGRTNGSLLNTYMVELAAEQAYASGDYTGAADRLQELLDSGLVGEEEKGWYLQEMARYRWLKDRPESEKLQVAAHRQNRMLLKPASGVTVTKLTLVSHGRVERIAEWIGEFYNYSELDARISDITARLVFGTKADSFEQALDELCCALGFAGERPDREWKEGPDNLWALDDTHYILWECKSEVDVNRSEINKRETEQMNRSIAWFRKHYPGTSAKRLIVHPSNTVAISAAFIDEVEAVREPQLRRLVRSVKEFFKSFESANFEDLSATRIQKLVDAHKLSVSDLLSEYSKKLYDRK
jgi:replicative superfamily II helicase